MAEPIEGRAREIVNANNFCALATVRPDGSPHVVPVWVSTDGKHLLLNSAEGRAWPRNLDRDPRATCVIQNMENPYEYVEVRGRVAERTNEGAVEHANDLARQYMGADEYPLQPGEQRVLYRIEPERVQHVRAG